ncbi:MAG: GNAT family N-acetyltransferase [Bacteroidetes bacterium]|nr:GNAT family N-acetyltransferase [Bacteroidota bacterium]
MNKEILLSEDEFTVAKYDGIPEHVVQFWERIAWGNEGAVYQNMKVSSHIPLIVNPTLFAIEREDRILGTGVFSNMEITSGSDTYNCQYVRYFAMDPETRGQGIMKRFTLRGMLLVRGRERRKTVYFALVERGNKASFKAAQNTGYAHVGTIKTFGFSRFFPKGKINLSRLIDAIEKEQMLNKLKESYKNHSLVQFNPVFLDNQYVVIKNESGDIMAGCQYHRCHWKVNRLPGKSGKILLKLLPEIPFLNRIFNPNKFEFLAFEALYVQSGKEKWLEQLFEGILYEEKLHSAMFWLDEKDPMLKRIRSKFKLGLIHSFLKKNDVCMMQDYHGLSEQEIQEFTTRSFYASAFDYA